MMRQALGWALILLLMVGCHRLTSVDRLQDHEGSVVAYMLVDAVDAKYVTTLDFAQVEDSVQGVWNNGDIPPTLLYQKSLQMKSFQRIYAGAMKVEGYPNLLCVVLPPGRWHLLSLRLVGENPYFDHLDYYTQPKTLVSFDAKPNTVVYLGHLGVRWQGSVPAYSMADSSLRVRLRTDLTDSHQVDSATFLRYFPVLGKEPQQNIFAGKDPVLMREDLLLYIYPVKARARRERTDMDNLLLLQNILQMTAPH